MGTYQSVKIINPYGVETDVLKINSDGEFAPVEPAVEPVTETPVEGE